MTYYDAVFFIGLIALYTVIQRNIAINRRSSYADKVDAYLSKNNDVPDEYKQLVYFVYADCLDHLLPLKIGFGLIFNSNRNDFSKFDSFLDQYGAEDTKEMLKLMSQGIFINLKMCPAQYFLIGVVLVCKALVTNSIYGLRSQIEGALLKTLH